MSLEVHIDWRGATRLVGHLHTSDRGPAVTFAYDGGWLAREDRFAIDPTGLPLGTNPLHGASLFGAMQDCGPDRWGRVLIERAVRRQVLDRKPYREIDYVLALDDTARIGILRCTSTRCGKGQPRTSRIVSAALYCWPSRPHLSERGAGGIHVSP